MSVVYQIHHAVPDARAGSPSIIQPLPEFCAHPCNFPAHHFSPFPVSVRQNDGRRTVSDSPFLPLFRPDINVYGFRIITTGCPHLTENICRYRLIFPSFRPSFSAVHNGPNELSATPSRALSQPSFTTSSPSCIVIYRPSLVSRLCKDNQSCAGSSRSPAIDI